MGKLLIPHPNEREKAVFSKAGITMLETMAEQDFLDAVIDYLDGHNVLQLATCRDNEPRCTTLEYFNNGLTVYVLSEGGGKIANLKANPRVCYTVSDPYHPAEDFFGASGVQVWGRASVFKKNDDPEGFKRIRAYVRTTEALKKQGLADIADSFNFNVITIEPEKIRYLSYRKGFRNVIWKKEG